MRKSPLESSRDHCAFCQFHKYCCQNDTCHLRDIHNLSIIHPGPMYAVLLDWTDRTNKTTPKTERKAKKTLAVETGTRGFSVSSQHAWDFLGQQSAWQALESLFGKHLSPTLQPVFSSPHPSQGWHLYKLLLINVDCFVFPQILNLENFLLASSCLEFCPLISTETAINSPFQLIYLLSALLLFFIRRIYDSFHSFLFLQMMFK